MNLTHASLPYLMTSGLHGSDFINNLWHYLAFDPQLLEQTWQEVKAVMVLSALDPLTKEMLYVAVSIANSCSYCIHSHTAAAKAKGMTDAQHADLTPRGLTGSQDQPFAKRFTGACRRAIRPRCVTGSLVMACRRGRLMLDINRRKSNHV